MVNKVRFGGAFVKLTGPLPPESFEAFEPTEDLPDGERADRVGMLPFGDVDRLLSNCLLSIVLDPTPDILSRRTSRNPEVSTWRGAS